MNEYNDVPLKSIPQPEIIGQLIKSNLTGKEPDVKIPAKLVVQTLYQYFRQFAQESASLGLLTPESTPEIIEAFQKLAANHGQIITTALFPLGEAGPLVNPFFREFLREAFKLWPISPTHRTPMIEEKGKLQRFYHSLVPGPKDGPGYFALLQRDAVGKGTSSPHKHWSVEAYTYVTGGTQIVFDNDSKHYELKAAKTIVVPPGRIHAVANPTGIMSLTFLEMFGNPAPIK